MHRTYLATLLLAPALAMGCSDDAPGDPIDTADIVAADATDTAIEDTADAPEEVTADVATDVPTDAGPPPLYAAANSVSENDPLAAGQRAYFHETFGGERTEGWPPAEFMLALMRDEPEVFGNQFERFGFLPDPNDDFPVGLKRGAQDPELVNETCALCHVGELPDGRIWIGAPNGALDLEGFNVAVNERWVAAGNPPLMTELQIEKAVALGPGRTNAETRDYPRPVPADFPTYFALGERTALNYLGTGRNVRTEAYFAIRAFGPGNPTDDEAVVPFPTSEETAPLLQFLASLQAPDAPAQDAEQVARGAEVFEEARCGSCHHPDDPASNAVVTYAEDGIERYPGNDPDYPNGSIATSENHLLLQTGGAGVSDDGYGAIISFILDQGLAVRQTDGYRAAYLRGVWATAPYLHNGSVPTLEDLFLPPDERPARFDRAGFEVDTTADGSSNAGHAFGTELSSDDRTALVAFLRTL